jgi:hypothetical protein
MKVYEGDATWSRTFGGIPFHLVLSCGSYREIQQAYSKLKREGLKVAINKHEDNPSEAYDLYVSDSDYNKYKDELYKGMWRGKRLS